MVFRRRLRLEPTVPPPTNTQACAPSDAPTPDTVAQAIASLPQGAQWRETSRGHTPDCRLNWVVVTAGDASDSPHAGVVLRPQQLARPGHAGAASVHQRHSMGNDTANVQYQWRQGQDPACCPTGIGTVRFQIGDDGKLESLDPIPNP